MAQVKLEIDGLNATQLSARLRTIASALTANTNVPAPSPAPTALSDAADLIEQRYTLQKQQELEAQAATSLTEQAMASARDLLRTEARTVQTATGGDPAKILTTGFAVEKEREAAQLLPAPSGFTATYGDDPGEIDLSWDPLPGRPYYTAEIADLAAGPWRHAGNGTRSRLTLKGLVSGQAYFIRVRGENPAGPGSFTNPVQQRAS